MKLLTQVTSSLIEGQSNLYLRHKMGEAKERDELGESINDLFTSVFTMIKGELQVLSLPLVIIQFDFGARKLYIITIHMIRIVVW